MRTPKNNRPAVFVDVDGTLVEWSKRNGRFEARLNAQLNERLYGIWLGYEGKPTPPPDLILWSRRGREYAQAMADKFDVAWMFCAIIGKPTTIIDDEGLEWMKGVRVQKK